MERFPISNRGKIFHREITLPGQKRYERILIDKLPQDLTEIIKSGLDQGINHITTNMPREAIEALASNTSEFFYNHLPFDMYASAKEFYDNGSKQETFDKEYFFTTPNEKPHLLSELYEDDMFNCIGQNLAIKEVLGSNKWGMYALFNQQQEGGHHILASILGDYCIRIDGSRGPQRKRQEQDNNHIYSFDKKCFYKCYQRTIHLDQKVY